MVSCCHQLQLEEELRNWERGTLDMDTEQILTGGREWNRVQWGLGWQSPEQQLRKEVRNPPVGALSVLFTPILLLAGLISH